MKTVLVRFPNESAYQEIIVDMSKFKPERFNNKEVFGYYNGTYLAIKVEEKLFEPVISDNFQIGPGGAYEHEED